MAVGSAGWGAYFPPDARAFTAESITRQIEDTPVVYENTFIRLRVVFGLHVVAHNDTLETIIHSADSSLRTQITARHKLEEEEKSCL